MKIAVYHSLLIIIASLLMLASAQTQTSATDEETDGKPVIPVVVDTLDDYVWNWLLWYISYIKMLGCSFMALWGIFMLDDNGLMAERCFQTGRPGARVSYSGYPKIKKTSKTSTA